MQAFFTIRSVFWRISRDIRQSEKTVDSQRIPCVLRMGMGEARWWRGVYVRRWGISLRWHNCPRGWKRGALFSRIRSELQHRWNFPIIFPYGMPLHGHGPWGHYWGGGLIALPSLTNLFLSCWYPNPPVILWRYFGDSVVIFYFQSARRNTSPWRLRVCDRDPARGWRPWLRQMVSDQTLEKYRLPLGNRWFSNIRLSRTGWELSKMISGIPPRAPFARKDGCLRT